MIWLKAQHGIISEIDDVLFDTKFHVRKSAAAEIYIAYMLSLGNTNALCMSSIASASRLIFYNACVSYLLVKVSL